MITLKDYKSILATCKKIEINMKQYKVYSELSERPKNDQEIFKYMEEKITSWGVKNAILVREAVIINKLGETLIKKIDEIFLKNIKENDVILLLDFLKEQYEDIRIDLCTSILQLFDILKGNFGWIEAKIDSDFEELRKEIEKNWKDVTDHQEMIDRNEYEGEVKYFPL